MPLTYSTAGLSERLTAPSGCDSVPPDRQRQSDFTFSERIMEIKEVWARGPASTLELAMLMCAVRQQLLHGEWTALWNGRDLPFSKRKGEMLVAIGEGLGWAGAQTFALLPVGWSILYHLARLDRRTLERFIQERVIHSALTVAEARQLAAQFRGQKRNNTSARVILLERFGRFERFVRVSLPHWSPAEKELGQAKLTRLIEHRLARRAGLLLSEMAIPGFAPMAF